MELCCRGLGSWTEPSGLTFRTRAKGPKGITPYKSADGAATILMQRANHLGVRAITAGVRTRRIKMRLPMVAIIP